MQFKVGKDNSFFLLLEGQAEVAKKAALAFKATISDFDNLAVHAEKMLDLEHDGDDLTHKLQNHVAESFITPLDKEDLRDLSQTLDDITDAIESVVARAKIYRLKTSRADLVPLADLMVDCTEMVVSVVKELRTGLHGESLHQKLEQIHTIENDSDHLYRTALENLFFQDGIDALEVMKWKEIYDRIEIAMDFCEDIAKIIGTFVVKYA